MLLVKSLMCIHGVWMLWGPPALIQRHELCDLTCSELHGNWHFILRIFLWQPNPDMLEDFVINSSPRRYDSGFIVMRAVIRTMELDSWQTHLERRAKKLRKQTDCYQKSQHFALEKWQAASNIKTCMAGFASNHWALNNWVRETETGACLLAGVTLLMRFHSFFHVVWV